ncbi:MAG: hypothetical protein ABIT05_04435 [Chitinophagaceae bacterium]
MKKLMILLLAAGLFTACNSKSKTESSSSREKDDYNSRSNDSGKNVAPTDNTKVNENPPVTDNTNSTDNTTSYTASEKWPASERISFISNCVSTAVEGKMDAGLAKRYCECMQVKMEVLYPDIRDAAALSDADMATPSMQRIVKDCLK